jgi:PAS domain S-box-containing protein
MALNQLFREHLYRALMDHPESLICAHSLDGTLLYVNPAVANFVGYDPKDMVGDSIRTYLPSSAHDGFDQYLQRVAAETPISGIWSVVHRDGRTLRLAYQNFRIDTDGRAFVIGCGIDVTADYPTGA